VLHCTSPTTPFSPASTAIVPSRNTAALPNTVSLSLLRPRTTSRPDIQADTSHIAVYAPATQHHGIWWPSAVHTCAFIFFGVLCHHRHHRRCPRCVPSRPVPGVNLLLVHRWGGWYSCAGDVHFCFYTPRSRPRCVLQSSPANPLPAFTAFCMLYHAHTSR
jgi:hypothetical protein